MAHWLHDLRGGAALTALAVMALAPPAVVPAARLPAEPIQIGGLNPRFNFSDSTFSLEDVTLSQGKDIRIVAKQAHWLDKGQGDSDWNLTGAVHIEFRDAILDADAAKIVFSDGELETVNVQGAPARFSHELKDSGRRNQGSARVIDYHAASGRVRLSGDTWYSDGRNEARTETLVYSLDERVLTSEGDGTDATRVQLTIRPDRHVPTPRTPDRESAR